MGTFHSSVWPILPTDSKNCSLAQIAVDRYLLYLTLADNAMIDNPGSLEATVQGYYQARTFYEPQPNAKTSIADYSYREVTDLFSNAGSSPRDPCLGQSDRFILETQGPLLKSQQGLSERTLRTINPSII